ncbi:hypothetical protein HQN90_33195 [Paenibacillus alba]|uniref:hypothetical protein n=1 Tax=Paenibacillus alba TaxID=1197127 RepID=UPI001566988B|nr:hypothetical protein [Paenibacillus alba]NQX71001.1 hypothetical protein [Paenibacillus alba]
MMNPELGGFRFLRNRCERASELCILHHLYGAGAEPRYTPLPNDWARRIEQFEASFIAE